MSDSPETVTDAVALLRELGYSADFELVDGVLQGDGGTSCAVADAVVERLYRFEGDSDPGDEMIVFALFDPVSGMRGTLATAYGPAADPQLRQHLSGLRTRFQ